MNQEPVDWLVAEVCAIRSLLIAKGILTAKEIDDVHSCCIAALDQRKAEVKEDFLKEHPGFALLDKLLGV